MRKGKKIQYLQQGYIAAKKVGDLDNVMQRIAGELRELGEEPPDLESI